VLATLHVLFVSACIDNTSVNLWGKGLAITPPNDNVVPAGQVTATRPPPLFVVIVFDTRTGAGPVAQYAIAVSVVFLVIPNRRYAETRSALAATRSSRVTASTEWRDAANPAATTTFPAGHRAVALPAAVMTLLPLASVGTAPWAQYANDVSNSF